MAKSTIKLTDKNFRITIPYDTRLAENLKIGDIIEIDIFKYNGIKNEISCIKESIKNLTQFIIKQNKKVNNKG